MTGKTSGNSLSGTAVEVHVFPMNDQDWFTPVTLTAKSQSKTVGNFLDLLLPASHDFSNRFFFIETVQEVRVDVKTILCRQPLPTLPP